MKNSSLLILILIAVISCKSKNKTPVSDTASQSDKQTANTIPNRDSLQQIKTIMHGNWVKSDYIADLIRTKSPYISSKKLSGIAALEISLGSAKSDSLVAGVSLNNHEGANLTLFLKQGNNRASFKTNWIDYEVSTNYYELGYQITGGDTSLLLYHYNKNNQVIDSTKYIRVLDKQIVNDMGYGIDYITNKLLISGDYIMTGADGKQSSVTFTNAGKVRGFSEYETYYVNTDFVAGPENDLDQLSFNVDTHHQKNFLFRVKGDTLNIYKTDFSADSIHLKWGKLEYELVKRK
ncbi:MULTISPECIES: hypothetical protein [Mucilaginibacter]|uniref:hypothetical protein n=1 Tax=Mucilaginibacter TaxID=423349 RepID=UPI00087190DA|nr:MULTISPECIES: hypothetical protein [Mucilaginibacter]GGB12067.1 hypothetical protein GCM10011500_29940 [Mucilaginibacter rubeus]SCW64815.1 hypothetical protein SAMN03159284_02717 [Mucilaginibacter sp. NFR10]